MSSFSHFGDMFHTSIRRRRHIADASVKNAAAPVAIGDF